MHTHTVMQNYFLIICFFLFSLTLLTKSYLKYKNTNLKYLKQKKTAKYFFRLQYLFKYMK